MRNLKKLISLVLVVAMIASICVAGMFSASAADVSNYPNAADVITTLKVMEGDEGGMRYQDTVTREEAATIICRLLLNPTVASLLKGAVNAPFEDTTGWSAGYVAYLKDRGIVNGKTETTFDPKGNVTGLEFAKMLLTALGYGKAGEYVGASWDINTIVDANTLKVFAGTLATDLTAPATREECMLYAYNVLFKNTVAYSKDKGTYENTSKILAASFDLGNAEPATDVFGRLTYVYKIGNKIGVTTPNTAAYKGTFSKLNSDVIYDAIGYAATALTTATLVVDGKEADTPVTLDPIKDGDKKSNTNLMKDGGTAELYYQDGKLTIVVIYEYIGSAVVNKVAKTTSVDTLLVPQGFTCADKDMVLYTKAYNYNTLSYIMQSAEVAEGVVGAYSANNTDGTAPVVAGVRYAYSPTNDANQLPKAPTGTNYVIYTDSKGAIIFAAPNAEAPVISTNYVYLIQADAQNHAVKGASGLLDNTAVTDAKALVRVAYTDGKIETVAYTIADNNIGQKTAKFNGKTYVLEAGQTDDASALKSAMTPGWYAYTAAEDGSLSLEAVNAMFAKTASGAVSIAKGNRNVAGVTGMIATTNTVENIIYNGKKAGFVTATGYLNFAPINAAAADVLVTYVPNSTQIAAINVYVAGDEPGAPAPKPEMVYLLDAGTVYTTGTEYSYVQADGTVKTFIIAGEKLNRGVYTLTYNAQGAPVLNAVTGVKYAAFENGAAKDDSVISLVQPTYFQTKDMDASKAYELNAKDPVVVTDLTGNGVKTLAEGQIVSILTTTVDGYTYVTNVWIEG